MIKKTIFILACALMELAPSGIITYAADQNRPKKIKVLLIDGQNNHDWVRCSPVMMDTLNATGRFSIDRSTVTKPDIEKFNPNFADYDVVLSNYNGERWKKETEEAFVKYIKEGGNLVVVHAANNSFPDWKEFNEMIGLGGWGGRNEKDGPYIYWKDGKIVKDHSKGRGGSHGKHWEYKVIIREKDHPITRGLPAEFLQAKEELYDLLRGPGKNMTILATAFAKGGSERDEPVLMTISYGKGRIFHTVMGHSHTSMKGVSFQETLKRGTEWAETGKVTFSFISASELPVNRAASREPEKIKRAK